ncbi:MAG: amidase [Acidobacteriota bacterium]|nr:amidase [Acidobacteriota bacterium]
MLESVSSSLCDLSSAELARLIRERDLTALEVTEAHLERIAEANPKVNAIVTLTADRALAQAAEADRLMAAGFAPGPLHGLPVVHKDLQPTRGVRTTFGSRIFADFIPDFDSLLVERVRNAGGIALGKTNTPEFGAGSQTFNEVFGPTLNPRDTAKTCGGSTGGGAVALACGMAALADGSDLGGSLRNPASFCGVVGMRPSAGRVPKWPNPFAWLPLSVEGPMARTVEDAALFLSALAGPDPRAPLSLPEPGSRFAASLGRDFNGVRVAWWKDLGGIPVDPEVRNVTNAQRALFESLGCIVEEAEPSFGDVDWTFRTLRFWMTLAHLGPTARRYPDLIKDAIHWEIEQASKATAADIGLAHIRLGEIRERMARFMERYEFFVLPVSQLPPFDVTLPWPREVDGTKLETYIDWMKSCYYISTTGVPAISVPCGFTAQGLPIGLQIAGRHNDDFGLLRIARAFEQARNLTGRGQI